MELSAGDLITLEMYIWTGRCSETENLRGWRVVHEPFVFSIKLPLRCKNWLFFFFFFPLVRLIYEQAAFPNSFQLLTKYELVCACANAFVWPSGWRLSGHHEALTLPPTVITTLPLVDYTVALRNPYPEVATSCSDRGGCSAPRTAHKVQLRQRGSVFTPAAGFLSWFEWLFLLQTHPQGIISLRQTSPSIPVVSLVEHQHWFTRENKFIPI